jgi:Domain of unknown function (DUF4123)
VVETVDFDLTTRQQTLCLHWPQAQLYALVDGLAYETHFVERLVARTGVHALWESGPDAALAYAGPWLVDWQVAPQSLRDDLLDLEPRQPALSWFFSEQPAAQLLGPLRRNLTLQRPDGSTALLRYHDPRVLVSLLHTLTPEQYQAFCGFALEWWVWRDGELGPKRDETRQRLAAPMLVQSATPGSGQNQALSQAQWQALRSDEAERFVAAACDQLLSLDLSLASTPGRPGVLERLRSAHAVAGQLGMTSTPHVLRWMHLVAHAPALAQDAAVRAWLQRPDQNTGQPQTPEARLDDLLALIDHQLQGTD